MKVSSSLLKAVLVTATLGAATGCKTIQPVDEAGKSVIQSVKQVFQRTGQPDNCPACGMG